MSENLRAYAQNGAALRDEGRDMCVSHEDGVACGRPESEHCEKKEIGSYWCGIRCEKVHHEFEVAEEVGP